tara:strand:- start:29 stop:484 length:456 start_codon:yes stop_codon:yes gene_type:complete
MACYIANCNGTDWREKEEPEPEPESAEDLYDVQLSLAERLGRDDPTAELTGAIVGIVAAVVAAVVIVVIVILCSNKHQRLRREESVETVDAEKHELFGDEESLENREVEVLIKFEYRGQAGLNVRVQEPCDGTQDLVQNPHRKPCRLNASC